MAATRLALSMDTSVVERARQSPELPPLTRLMRGLAKGKDAFPPDWDYREALSDILVERHA